MTKYEYLEKHPEDKVYFALVAPTLNRQMETNPDNYVVCKICGQKVSHINGNHLKKHNITLAQYIEAYGDKELVCKNFHETMSKSAIQVNTNMTISKTSKAENEIKDFIENNGLETKMDRTILKGKEIDIYIPSKKIGIEYNGIIWHTEWFGQKDKRYHYNKMQDCLKAGVKLISIFEDEYALHKEIVKNKLSHILGFDKNKPKIYARKCDIKEIIAHDANNFYNKYHIQGTTHATVHLGAYYKNKLVAVMSFVRRLPYGTWELVRFASDYHYICSGLGGKLFSFFIKNYNFKEIKSFADRRWTINENDNLYTKLGFVNDGIVPPSFTYYYPKVYGIERKHRYTLKKIPNN